MIAFSNPKELNKIVRQFLIEQSQLDSSRVLNALSTYGTELDKLIDESIYNSIEQENTTLLFQLQDRDSNSNVSYDDIEIQPETYCSNYTICSNDLTYHEEREKDVITYNKAFNLKLIIYGEESSNLALQLVARFRTENVRTRLYNRGIYLERIEDPTIINEYKNDSMWIRNDINILLNVEYQTDYVTTSDDYSSFNIKII